MHKTTQIELNMVIRPNVAVFLLADWLRSKVAGNGEAALVIQYYPIAQATVNCHAKYEKPVDYSVNKHASHLVEQNK